MDTCLPTKLSVIVPIYNAETTLTACVHSILQTNRNDMEVLLVNDGSTDGSNALCEQFAKEARRIIYIRKQNGGVSSARNAGLIKARGEWIAFVDADDQATKEYLEFNPSNDTDLVCFNWRYTTGETENEHLTAGLYKEKTMRNFLDVHLVDYIFRTPWAKLFKRNIIKSAYIRFDERFNVGEDNLFVRDYLFECRSIQTVDAIAYIYLRPGQRKYPLSIKTATDFMTIFMDKHERQGIPCQPLLLLLETYYFMALGENSFRMHLAWESCKAVRRLQDICWNRYGIRDKITILLRRILIYIGQNKIKSHDKQS